MPGGGTKTKKLPKKVKLEVKVESYTRKKTPIPEAGEKKAKNIFEIKREEKAEKREKAIKVEEIEYAEREEVRGKAENQKEIPIESIKDEAESIPEIIELSPEQKEEFEQKLERKKEIMMWAGVSFCMVIIFVVWIFNTKLVFETARAKSTGQSMAVDDLRKMSSQIGEKVEAAKSQAGALSVDTTTTTTTTEMALATGTIAMLPQNEMASGTVENLAKASSSLPSVDSAAVNAIATGTK